MGTQSPHPHVPLPLWLLCLCASFPSSAAQICSGEVSRSGVIMDVPWAGRFCTVVPAAGQSPGHLVCSCPSLSWMALQMCHRVSAPLLIAAVGVDLGHPIKDWLGYRLQR